MNEPVPAESLVDARAAIFHGLAVAADSWEEAETQWSEAEDSLVDAADKVEDLCRHGECGPEYVANVFASVEAARKSAQAAGKEIMNAWIAAKKACIAAK